MKTKNKNQIQNTKYNYKKTILYYSFKIIAKQNKNARNKKIKSFYLLIKKKNSCFWKIFSLFSCFSSYIVCVNGCVSTLW